MQHQILYVRQELNLQTRLLHYQTEQIDTLNSLAEKTFAFNQKIESSKQEKNFVYRKILSDEKNCNVAIPESIAHELLSRAYRLRTFTLPKATNGVDPANISPPSARKLTYCHAVLWINSLLSSLEQANNQLQAIRMSQKTVNIKK